MKYKFLFVIFISFLFLSCKKDPKCYDPSNVNCANYNPCFGKEKINAVFKVKLGNRGFPAPPSWCELISCDTFNTSSVLFEIPDGNPDYCTYEWQIGDEPKPRYDNKFEVDFSDYLNKGKWESYIPITLIIRTPLNNCLKNPADTLLSVTKELFFTEKYLSLFTSGEKKISYKGYLTNDPNKEIILQFIQLDTGSFRGIKSPVFLTVGWSFIDTFAVPPSCIIEGCNNFVHSRQKALYPDKCNPQISNYWSGTEWIMLNGIKKIELILEFSKPSGFERYEFIGIRQ